MMEKHDPIHFYTDFLLLDILHLDVFHSIFVYSHPFFFVLLQALQSLHRHLLEAMDQ